MLSIQSIAAVVLALAVIATILIVLPYSTSAEYEGGVSFHGLNWGGCYYVHWARSAEHPRCPLRVRLPQGDLGEAELASADGMRAAGAAVAATGMPGVIAATLERGDVRV